MGSEYKYDEKTLLKAKVNQEGLFGLAFNRKLSDHWTVTTAAEIDSNKVFSTGLQDYKFGFRFDFN